MEPAPIIVALDGMAEGEALALARLLAGTVWGFKVNDLLSRVGREVVPRLKGYGKVFCDPKLHDIPNTVANQIRVFEEAGADLITLHCSGGLTMLRAAREARAETARLLGVTVLTAMPEADVARVYGRSTEEAVNGMVATALEAGLDGIVCSPRELEVVGRADPERRLLRVTPGVRPSWAAGTDDQQRVLTPLLAKQRGADLLVIGRPITAADDPAAACRRIAEELF